MARTEDMEHEVRVRLGKPPETELPSEQVTLAVSAALREFSRYRPRLAETRLSLTPGRAEYPLPPGTIGVFEAIPERLPLRGGLPWEQLPVGPDPAGVLLMEAEGSLDPWNVLDNQLRGIRDDAGFLTEVIPPPDDTPNGPPTLRLVPTPGRMQRLTLTLETVVPVESLPRLDVETVLLYARAECLEFRGLKRNKSVWSIPTATGKLNLDTGEQFLKLAGELRDTFEKRMGRGATAMIVG
jgi:hypothetical protein